MESDTNTRIAERLGWERLDTPHWDDRLCEYFYWKTRHGLYVNANFDEDAQQSIDELDLKGWSWVVSSNDGDYGAQVFVGTTGIFTADSAGYASAAEALVLAFLAALDAEVGE